jgi:hypothetical protein
MEREPTDTGSFCSDRWKNCSDWSQLVATGKDWLMGKVEGRHPISNELCSNLDTDDDWTRFLLRVADMTNGLTIDSQTGAMTATYEERPYVAVVTSWDVADAISEKYASAKGTYCFVLQVAFPDYVRFLTPNTVTEARSCTRSGTVYDVQVDNRYMNSVGGTPRYVLTRELMDDSRWNLCTCLGEDRIMKMELDLDIDDNIPFLERIYPEFSTVYFASTQFGNRKEFISSVLRFLDFMKEK